MFATQIRPVTDLRNHYPEVESDLERGPVVLTKNGYGASVLVSISLYDKLMAKQALYEAIAKSEDEINVGEGLDAKAALAKMRATLHV
jgi:prevent-host-death family protein